MARNMLPIAHEAAWPADVVHVFDEALEDEVDGQGDDGQIVAAGAEGGHGHQQAKQRRGDAPGQMEF
jgi:hypothetical protein